MKIALVIGQLTRGGAEGQLVELARRLPGRGVASEVYVLSGSTEPYGAILREAGIPISALAGSLGQRVIRLARALRRERVDLVHSWLYLANPIAALASWLGGGVPLITAARNCKVQGPLYRGGNIWAFRRSRRIIVNSPEVREFIVQRYLAPRERIRLVPNGIDLARFCPPEHRSPEAPLVVTAGRLVEQKNHRLFLEAAAALRLQLPSACFAIVGDGPLRRELETYCQRLQLQSAVQFLGERPDVEEVFREASLFWLTSSWEGMPNVLLEAMACGLPVVASDVSGVRMILGESRAGAVVAPGDRDAFVRASMALLGSGQVHRAASEAARQRAEDFSLSRMVERTTEVYTEVLR